MRPSGASGAVATAAVLLALVIPLGSAGCGRPRPPGPDVVAKIGGSEIRHAQFEAYLRRAVGGSGEGAGEEGEGVLASDALSGLFDQFLDEELLARLAAERGLMPAASGADPGADSAAGRRRAVDRLLESLEAGEPTEAEIAAYYRAHREEFARPERVRLRQILTAERAAAEGALRELAAGADFAELARRVSRDPSAATGGEQGELARADLPPAFAEVIFALRPGEVSRLVPADYGFHVFQVTERLPAEVVPLPQVRGEVAERLRRERADRRLRELVEEARSAYDVTVYERNLPFNYKGFYGHDKPTPSP